MFRRYVGVDYSGAKTPSCGLPGLRVYVATARREPVEVSPPRGGSKHWSRRGVAEWLIQLLSDDERTIVGIDHGFSFPLRYFERHGLALDWPAFLDDFCAHWPTASPDTSVEMVRTGATGRGAARGGEPTWRRLAETRSRRAKSVFHFDVQGSVAKSTHAGLPWIREIRARLADRVHVWPFDGWLPREGRSVLAEVYPSMWSASFPADGRTADQHDAWTVAAWLREADRAGRLPTCFAPAISETERATAAVEGWILGLA